MFSKHSIREVISNLEKIHILSDKDTLIDIEKCKNIISNISHKQFETYIQEIKNNNLEKAVEILYTIHDYGYSVIDILDMFFGYIKISELLNEEQKYILLPVLCKYITYFHNLHEDIIELVLFTYDIHSLL
jgi:DNA polymerase III gamma/tau subunit